MSLRAALLVLAAKQSPIKLGIASDKEQERPRNDIRLVDNTHPQRKACSIFSLR